MDNLIIFGAKYLIFIIILISAAVWLKAAAKSRWQFAAAVVLAGIIAFALSKITGALYYHSRPFVVQNITPLISHGNDNGFPSDHTLLAMTLSSVVYYYRPHIAAGLVGLTFLVGISRVLAHVHSPIDILGGLILGGLAGWTGYLMAKKLFPNSQKTILNQKDQ